VTILVCLGQTPDTWRQATNVIGHTVLSCAEARAADDDVRTVVFDGKIFHDLDLYDLEPRFAAACLATGRGGRQDRHGRTQRLDPDRPGAWPGGG
jgi:hypothetical protein